MTTKVLELTNIERKLFWILSGGVVLLLAFYLYSVVSLTVSGVERDQLLKAARGVSAQMTSVEGEYLALENTITPSRATDLGFHEVAAKFAGAQVATLDGAKLSFAR